MGYEWSRRPTAAPSEKFDVTTLATTGGVTISPIGIHEMTSTTTGVPVLVTLGTPLEPGVRKTIVITTVGATSSAPFHINMPSSNTTVDGSTADMITLSSAGAAITLVAKSSSQWLVESHRNASFSTST